MAVIKNIGKVIEVKDGIVISDGISEVGYNELVNINTKNGIIQGIALNLEEETTGIITLGDNNLINEGDIVETTGKLLSIKVDKNLLGKVIDPLGLSKEGEEIHLSKDFEEMPLESVAPGVIERRNVYRPLETGILAIDSMFPIGRGQRELIIGDRQTGKTAICIDTIINQKGKNVYCIYVGIGQKTSKIAQIKAKLAQYGALDYTVIVAANASDPTSLQYIAPYAGCAIGEYFAKKGLDALIIYDDLTKHAWAYRELSLLLRRPPGREAYPGDIFYLHSRLLERAIQYSDEKGGGSLTALPIVETQAGDVSAYIPTNIISITDGQIYLETDLFNAGQRPAINIGISVSRVGGDAQIKPMKQVAGQLKLDLAQYRELATFAQFGSELDEQTKYKLDRGGRLMELLKQNQFDVIPAKFQICLLFAVNNGLSDHIEIHKISLWKKKLFEYIKVNKIADLIKEDSKLDEDDEKKLIELLEDFNKKYYPKKELNNLSKE